MRVGLGERFGRVPGVDNKAMLKAGVKRFVAERVDTPVLYDYAADGTPLLSFRKVTAKLPSGQSVQRTGASRRKEYYNQRAYVAGFAPTGEVEVRTYFRDPVPLDKTDAMTLFACATSFMDRLRDMGHRGPCISAYHVDRKPFKPLVPLIQQWHRQWYEDADLDSDTKAWLQLHEFVFVIPCCHHACHNSLYWSVKHLLPNYEQQMKDFL